MTDKEIIRAWVKRREELLRSACKHSEANEMCYLLSFIDSMQEEPVSGDIEKEAEKYLEEHIAGGSATERSEFKTWGKYIARHFAAWQKQQMMKNAKSGVVKADYQIAMDDGLWLDLDPCMQLTPVLDVNPGDKVKIIAIKED